MTHDCARAFSSNVYYISIRDSALFHFHSYIFLTVISGRTIHFARVEIAGNRRLDEQRDWIFHEDYRAVDTLALRDHRVREALYSGLESVGSALCSARTVLVVREASNKSYRRDTRGTLGRFFIRRLPRPRSGPVCSSLLIGASRDQIIPRRLHKYVLAH